MRSQAWIWDDILILHKLFTNPDKTINTSDGDFNETLSVSVSFVCITSHVHIETQADSSVANRRDRDFVWMIGIWGTGGSRRGIRGFISWRCVESSNLPSKSSEIEVLLNGREFYLKKTIKISLLGSSLVYANVLKRRSKPQRDVEKVCIARARMWLDINVIFSV